MQEPVSPARAAQRRRILAYVIFIVWLLAIPLTVLYDPALRQIYHHWTDGMGGLDTVAHLLTAFVSLKILGPLALLLVMLDRRARWWLLGDLAIVMTAESVGETLLKRLFGRLRPDNPAAAGMSVFQGPHWASGFGFPSGHAFASFALAAVFSAWYPRWRWLFIIGAMAVALARVQLDRHFFGDVVFGAFLGWYMAWALLNWRRTRTGKAGRGPAEGEPAPDKALASETM